MEQAGANEMRGNDMSQVTSSQQQQQQQLNIYDSLDTTAQSEANQGNSGVDSECYITPNVVKPYQVAILKQELDIKGNVHYQSADETPQKGASVSSAPPSPPSANTTSSYPKPLETHGWYAGRNDEDLSDMYRYLDLTTSSEMPQQNTPYKKSY